MKIKKYNDEVIYTQEDITKVDVAFIDELKSAAMNNPRQRMRLCCHLEMDDVLHEMLIVHVKGAYVPPHKHINKTESFHIIEGELTIVIFNEEGKITDVIDMGDTRSGKYFYYRLKENVYHTVIPTSDIVVFHETTNGPFVRAEMIFADWAPSEVDYENQSLYIAELKQEIHSRT